MASKAVATTTDAEIVQVEAAGPEIRSSPDGMAVAIRTVFEDSSPGQVSSWLSVDHRGITTYLTEAQVTKWVKR